MMTMVISGSDGVTFPDSTNQYSGGAFSFKNRIINGDMRIDQRNAGASVTVSNGTITYGADRFLAYEDTSASSCTVQQVTDAPTNFNNSLKFTVGTGGSATASQLAVLETRIEGYNFADLNFGTANAKAFTLSFWVKSSATGTFCVAFRNASDNRSYVSTYSISSANTWEQKTVTVAGDTSGTWGTTNGIGISARFDMGSGSTYQTSTLNAWQSGLYFSNSSQVDIIGTSSATLQITGVQLEVGSVATPFERRPYGTELALCQRYYYLHASGVDKPIANACNYQSSSMYGVLQFPVTMRSAPTLSQITGTNYYRFYRDGATDTFDSFVLQTSSTTAYAFYNGSQISGTAGHGGWVETNNASSFIAFTAEL